MSTAFEIVPGDLVEVKVYENEKNEISEASNQLFFWVFGLVVNSEDYEEGSQNDNTIRKLDVQLFEKDEEGRQLNKLIEVRLYDWMIMPHEAKEYAIPQKAIRKQMPIRKVEE